MIVLTIRTDNPQAEAGLFDNQTKLEYQTWQAHRELSNTIHTTLEAVLTAQQKTWKDIDGIVVYQGPGSFTGLRIGMSVANALAASLHVPIVAEQTESWVQKGITRLQAGGQDEVALPFYGRDANITSPHK